MAAPYSRAVWSLAPLVPIALVLVALVAAAPADASARLPKRSPPPSKRHPPPGSKRHPPPGSKRHPPPGSKRHPPPGSKRHPPPGPKRQPPPGPKPNVVSYNLTVTYGYYAPDCVTKQVYLINGQFPGPTITATEGDILQVTVVNGLDMEGISIHWHGLRQLGNNLMDGTSFVTQCPIGQMDYKVYQMRLEKAGTFMYHGHLDDQSAAGLYGALIVKDSPSRPPPFTYDDDMSLMIGDWWHRSIYEQVVGLNSNPFGWVGEAQSLLLNGRGYYNCSLIPQPFPSPPAPYPTPAQIGDVKLCNNTNPQCKDRTNFTVETGKTYRLRIGSIASLQSMNLVLEGHALTVVAADGDALQPFTLAPNEGLDIYPGQTVDVLFTANQTSGNYWIRIGVIARNPATPYGLGVIHYSDAPAEDPTTAPPVNRMWNNFTFALEQAKKYLGHSSVPRVPLTSSRTVVQVGAQQKINGFFKWAINNISFEPPRVPFAQGIASGNSAQYGPPPPDNLANPWNFSLPAPTEAQYGSGYYRFARGAVIDIVVQNTNNIGPGSSEAHPWHIHGHQFWILAYGSGAFNESVDTASYNLVNPPFRNTVTVFPYGWVAIRFIADNPGIWLFHCHIGPHLHMGMATAFLVGQPMPLPPWEPRCGVHSAREWEIKEL